MTFARPHARTAVPRIAIVGGGPGGLLTAYFLGRAATRPLAITLFEGSGRLGGKVITPMFSAAPVRYEAGAAELYDYSTLGEDSLRDLVAEFGLPTVPLEGAAVVVDQASIANLDDLAAALGSPARRAFEAFDARARAAMTPREFYASDDPPTPAPHHAKPSTASPPGSCLGAAAGFDRIIDSIGHPAARRYVETLIHSDLATEPGKTSASYGLQNYLMNDPAYMRLYRIAGGNEQLIEALARRLDASVRLGTMVTEVQAVEHGGFRLTTAPDVGESLGPFDAVVMALPLQHLAEVRFRGDTLTTALERHRTRFDHPAHYLRVTVLCDEPVWRGRIDGGYVMLDAFGGACLYDESAGDPASRHGVLGWLLGGEAAETWSQRDDAALVAAAIDALPRSFGDVRSHLLEARVHRWSGAVSGLPGGWRPPDLDRRHQPAPVHHPHLFVVGDYLFDSTLNGVLDSAAYVADWLAADFC
jgi:monoamine oxidase